MRKYSILSTFFAMLLMLFSPTTLLAQGANRNFPLSNISCQSPWGGSAHQVQLGSIADPASISVPVQTVPINFDCDSRQFYEEPLGSNVWRTHGATCLAIDVAPGTLAAQRELTHTTDGAAPKVRFNFSYNNSAVASNAVGDAMGNGVGVPFYGFSAGDSATPTGSLKIGGTTQALGVYVHGSAGQPNDLRSGTYRGTFTWKLYAGTTDIPPPGNAPPLPEDCASNVGQIVQSGTIEVEVTIKTSCTLTLPSSGKDIDFGTVTVQEIAAGVGPLIHNLEVHCNNNNEMFVTIGAGQHSGGDINQRHMQRVGGSELVKYSLTKPGGGEWGDAPTMGSGHRVPGNFGSSQTVEIEARIPPQTGTIVTGDYKDTVQIQLWN